MAQCHAERRKHPSAMDFYVGALHSKLYNPKRDTDKYPHQPSYINTSSSTSSGSPICARPSQSFRKEATVGSRPSLFGGSFRESGLPAVSCSEVKLSSSFSYNGSSVEASKKSLADDVKFTQPMIPSLDCMNSPLRNADDASSTKCLSTQVIGAPIDKVSVSSVTKLDNVTTIKAKEEASIGCSNKKPGLSLQPTVNETIPPNAYSASLHSHGTVSGTSTGCQSLPGKSGERSRKPTLVAKSDHDVHVSKFPRSYKSAELGAPLANEVGSKECIVDGVNRLYKSEEQIAAKFTLNTSNLKESPAGGLIVGSQKSVGSGYGGSFSSTRGSPNATKDGSRWYSADSTGCLDLSPAKDRGRNAFSLKGCSSDGGSLSEAKDIDGRPTLRSGLINKDVAPVRGMGNILVGANNNGVGKVKLFNNKAGANDIKLGVGSSSKAEDLAHWPDIASLRGASALSGCSDGVIIRSLGNLCHGSRTSNVPSGNILNTGMASRNLIQQVEGRGTGAELLDPEDIKNAGNVQYKMGHFSEAMAFYDKSIAMSPNHAPYRSNRAAALAGLGRLGEAVVECEEAIKLEPQYLRAHQRAAHLYLRLGLIESAKRHFQATVGKDDAGVAQALHAVERHISRCIEARKVGDWRSALQASNAAVVAGADSAAQVLGYKSEALVKLHRIEEADAICAEAQRQEDILQKLGVASADSFLLMLRAHIETYLGRFEGAIVAAEAASKIDPRNIEVAAFLKKARAAIQARTSGNELFKAGRLFEACAVYGEGLESDPTNAVLLCNRAACRSKLGQWEKAIEDCDSALKAQPNYVKALMRRAHCSTKLERWEDALQDYEVLRTKMPSDMEVARGYFDVQVAIKKSRGEDIHKMKFGGEIEEVFNEGQLREVVAFAGVSVVQFITRWSDRCCQISSFIDQLSKQFPCVQFVKVDVEDNPYLAKIENVTFVPTFKIFSSGQRVKELQGPSEQALENAVKHYSL